jgi:hypothetical protein
MAAEKAGVVGAEKPVYAVLTQPAAVRGRTYDGARSPC